MTSTVRSFAPLEPEKLVAEAPGASRDELDEVVTRSGAAQSGWGEDAPGRSRALGRFAEAVEGQEAELASLIVTEVGKPILEARAEVARAVAILRYNSQLALDSVAEVFPGSAPNMTVTVSHEPLGVVLAICPWNLPLAIPLWKAAPALAFGNAVVIKPATAALGTALRIAEIADGVLPRHVLEVVPISGAEAGDLVDHPGIAGVTFTGSTAIGQSIVARATARWKPVQAEVGGQNPAIVLEDADLDLAADAIVEGAVSYSGQKCTATRRVITTPAIAGPLQDALASRFAELRAGDPSSETTIVGPLIDATAKERFQARLDSALGAGASLLARGPVPDCSGHFVPPILVAENDPDAEVNQTETFGPLLTALTVPDLETAIAVANGTSFGLVGAVHGCDTEKAGRIAARLACGLRRVNAATTGVEFYTPFGGSRQSSFGPREQGRAAREFFTETHTTTVVTYDEGEDDQ